MEPEYEDERFRFIVPAVACWFTGVLFLIGGALLVLLVLTDRRPAANEHVIIAGSGIVLAFAISGVMSAAGFGVLKGQIAWASAARTMAWVLAVLALVVSLIEGFVAGWRHDGSEFEFTFTARNIIESIFAGGMLLLADALSRLIKRRREELAQQPAETSAPLPR